LEKTDCVCSQSVPAGCPDSAEQPVDFLLSVHLRWQPGIQGDQEAVCPPDLVSFCGLGVKVGRYSVRRHWALGELVWLKVVVLPGSVWPESSPLLTSPI